MNSGHSGHFLLSSDPPARSPAVSTSFSGRIVLYLDIIDTSEFFTNRREHASGTRS